MRDTGREAETQAERGAGSMQGARGGTRSPDSRITPWAEGGAKPLSHLGCPIWQLLRMGLHTGCLTGSDLYSKIYGVIS